MGKIKRIILISVSLVFFIAAGVMIWQWRNPSNPDSSSSSESWGENLDTSDTSFTPSADVLNGNLDNIAEPSDWKIYKNPGQGFSMNIPQLVLGVDKCKNTKFEAPIAVIEDNKTGAIFVVPEYYYDKYVEGAKVQTVDEAGEITFIEDDPIDPGDPNLFDSDEDGKIDCRKKIYNLALIKQEVLVDIQSGRSDKIPVLGNPLWGVALRTAKVVDTEALNEFIRDTFGNGCVLASKTERAEQAGDYLLGIKKSGAKDSRGKELACQTDKVSDIIYNPAKNKLTYLYLNKDAILLSDASEGYDKEMIASFRFY